MSDTLAEIIPAHAPYGPSAAEGWSTCLDYINANRGLSDDSGYAASEGTFAHIISDECLLLGSDAHDFIGTRLKVRDWVFTWTEDDADLLQPGIDRIRSHEGVFTGEQRVDISDRTVPGQFGTLDRATRLPDIIRLEDLKWGRAVPVFPARNKQLVLYALGYWRTVAHLYDTPPEFILSIDQPRCAGGGGVWRTTLAELEALGNWLREQAALSVSMPNPPRVASEAGCMWCRRKNAPGGCDTYEEWRLRLLSVNPVTIDQAPAVEEIGLPVVSLMTPERRAFLVKHKNGIERWLDRLAEVCLSETLAGVENGILKAVDGRKKPDRWTDAAAAEPPLVAAIGDRAYAPRKILTPTQASKLISPDDRETIEPHIVRGIRDPALAPVEDARPALVRATADDFDDFTGTET